MVLRALAAMVRTCGDQSSVGVKKTPRYLIWEAGIRVSGVGESKNRLGGLTPYLEGERRGRWKNMISVLSISAERPKSRSQSSTSLKRRRASNEALWNVMLEVKMEPSST